MALTNKDVSSIFKTVKGYCRGCTYGFLWYSSILFGFIFLYGPLIPLLLFNRKLFRRGTDMLFATWEAFNAGLLQVIYGVKFVVTGDSLDPGEHSLLVSNHPTRTDWNFLWVGLLHAAPAHNAKIVLKEELRKIPGLGWIMSLSRFIHLKRKWKEDVVMMDQMMDLYSNIREEGGKQIILFPEGTNLSPTTREKSRKFALANNRIDYQHVLHPRTTGFVHLVQGMQDRKLLGSVYDVTIAYPFEEPSSEIALLSGQFPSEVHINFKRHPVASLPTTVVGLEKWLEEKWSRKEESLKSFQSSHTFPSQNSHQSIPRSLTQCQPVCLVASLLWLYWVITSVLFSLWGFFWAVGVISWVYFVEKQYGLHKIELNYPLVKSDKQE